MEVLYEGCMGARARTRLLSSGGAPSGSLARTPSPPRRAPPARCPSSPCAADGIAVR
jgi:hypothetical protein